jgi:hypothetical protein
MARRLARTYPTPRGMTEPQSREVEGLDMAFDRSNRIVRPNTVVNPRRQKGGLIPSPPRLERTIHHGLNRTSTSRRQTDILAQPRKRNPGYSIAG